MRIIELEQGSREWLEFRNGKIGASDAPIIYGCDPYRTPLQLWEEKMGGSKKYTTKAMKRRTELEPIAREMIERSHGIPYKPLVIQSYFNPFMVASLDGYNFETDNIIEIKCPNDETFNTISEGNIPIHYVIQMQHQMCVAGAEKVTLVVFDGNECKQFTVKRDQAIIDDLIRKEEAFYEHMVNYTPPPGALPKREDLDTMEAVLEAIRVRDKRDKKKEELKELEEEYSICKQELAALSNGESFECKGYKIKKSISPGRVDYKKVPQLQGVDLNPYRGDPIESWRID